MMLAWRLLSGASARRRCATLYKRIANAENKEQLRDLHIELIDRFGLLPESVTHLLLVTELKLVAKPLGITRIQAAQQQGKIEFDANPNINAGALIQCIQLHPKRYQLEGPKRLKFLLDSTSHEARIHEIQALLVTLRGNV